MASKNTIPTDLSIFNRYYLNDPVKNATAAIRESIENAVAYQASEALTLFGQLKQEETNDYLFVCHNGKPFEDVKEMIDKGITPNLSGGNGAALQGYGLVFCAGCLSMRAEIIIASRCENGQFSVVKGHSVYKDNEWVREDVTQTLAPKIKKLLGAKTVNNYNVFYLFKIDLPEKPNKSYLNGKIMASLAFLSDAFNQIKLIYCEKQIGCDSYTKGAGRNAEIDPSAVAKYASYDNAKKEISGGTGSISRPIVGSNDYKHLFCEREFIYNSLPDVKLPIQISNNPPTFIEATEFSLKIDAYRGSKEGAKKDGSKQPWFTCVRGNDNHEKGAGVAEGKMPSLKAFLTMSYIASNMQQGKQNNPYQRFFHNAVYSHESPAGIMRTLDLKYHEADDRTSRKPNSPFVIVSVNLGNISRCWRETINGEQNIEVNGSDVAAAFGRRADFFMNNKDACRNVVQAIAESLKNAVSESDHLYFSELFQMKEYVLPPLLLGIKDRVHLTTTPSPYRYFDLENNGEILDKHSLHVDSDRKIAILNSDTEKFLSGPEVQISTSTHGCTISEITANLNIWGDKRESQKIQTAAKTLAIKYNTKVPILNLSICALQRILQDGTAESIKPKEYTHGTSCQPSGSVIFFFPALLRQERVGYINEVPKRPHKPSEDSESMKVKQKETVSNNDHSKAAEPFSPRQSHFVATWHPSKKVLLLNQNHPVIHETFIQPKFPIGSKGYKDMVELYVQMNRLASFIAVTVSPDPTPGAAIITVNPPHIESPKDGEPILYEDCNEDYIINNVLSLHISQSPDFLATKKKIQEATDATLESPEPDDEVID